MGFVNEAIIKTGLAKAMEQAGAILVTDPNGEILFVNPMFTDLTGYTVDEVVGQSTRIFQSGKQPQALYDDLWRTIRSGQIWQGEIINRRKDGTLYNEAMRIAPVMDEHGKISSYVAIKRDITAQKVAEDAQAVLASIVESSQDAILATKLDGTVISWNRGAELLHGFSSDEIIGKNIAAIVPPGHLKGFEECLQVIRRGFSISPFDAVTLRKDGSLIDVSTCISPIWNSSGEVVGSSGIFRDIGPRLRSEQKLQESEECFRGVFEFAPFGICACKLDGEFTLVNPALCNMLGYPEPQLMAMTWMDLIHPDDISFFAGLTEHLQQAPDRCLELEQRCIYKNGSIIWVRLKISLVHDGNGNPLYFVIHVDDITERKRFVMALAESETRFRRLFEENQSVMLLVDPADGVIVNANRAASAFYGYARDQMIGMTIYQFNILPREEIFLQLERALREKRNCFNFRNRLASGEVRDVEIYATPIDIDGRSLLFSTIFDVT